MRTSNPAFTRGAFETADLSTTERMTVSGAVNRSLFLLGLLILSAVWSWQQVMTAPSVIDMGPTVPGWAFPAAIGGLILSLVIIFVQKTAPYLSPFYAVAEGLFLGVISAQFELRYPGIAFQAMLVTAATALAMLTAYRTGMLAATDRFRRGMMIAMGGLMLVYLLDFVLRLFHMNVPFIHETGPFGMLVSAAIVVLAALNLILDFDFVERGAQMGLPKYMEWYAAFGLMLTLVWLYLEVLRLLSKARER